MLRTTRRTLTGALLAVAVGAGLVVMPSPAQAATATGVIRVTGKLALRTAPSGGAAIAGALGNNARVAIDCVVSGQEVAGTVRTTTTWHRLTDGRYVSHAYVIARGTLTRCASGTPTAVPVKTKPAAKKPAGTKVTIGTVRSDHGAVNRRSGPSTSSSIKGSAANGSKLSLVCGVVGTRVVGTVRTTTQWNRLTDGSYISHAYVVTPTLYLCKDADSVPTPAPTLTNAQFIKAAVPGAQRGWREFGVPPSVTIAQAILESGWGRSSLSTQGRNYFGIK
ncbi:MAG TPA: glucosaminidase domain-containing protein, partial [Actinoplanes sp.]|nr:glucosaminidase domain-containing protein [Actinoplanes sp.]